MVSQTGQKTTKAHLSSYCILIIFILSYPWKLQYRFILSQAAQRNVLTVATSVLGKGVEDVIKNVTKHASSSRQSNPEGSPRVDRTCQTRRAVPWEVLFLFFREAGFKALVVNYLVFLTFCPVSKITQKNILL